ncbi:MAG: hypothetical protein KDA89_00795 [Planctomycetaceae bacterium]|nr:hypothetical protein [Planctomycetaceae bacterium]
MKHHLGILLQLLVLGMLPALIVFQLAFGMKIIVMPIALIIGMILFGIGVRLRQ